VLELPPVFAEDRPTLQCAVPVRNQTPGSVKFVRVEPSCGCTTATLDRSELAPGEETALRIEVNLAGRSGAQYLHCRLVDADGGGWPCAVRTTVLQRFQLTPDSVRFGSIGPNAIAERVVEVHEHAPAGSTFGPVVGWPESSNFVRVSNEGSTTGSLPCGIRFRKTTLRVRLSAGAEAGPYSTEVIAEGSPSTGNGRFRLPLTWSVPGSFEMKPPRAFFGTVKPSDKPIERRVRLRRTDGQSFLVRRITNPSSAIEVRTEMLAQARVCDVILRLVARGVESAVWGEVTIETDHAVQPLVKVPFGAMPEHLE
jgi:hypothetical protein